MRLPIFILIILLTLFIIYNKRKLTLLLLYEWVTTMIDKRSPQTSLKVTSARQKLMCFKPLTNHKALLTSFIQNT